MLDPQSPLGVKLRAHRVRVRAEGEGTLILQNVPANQRYFNKAGTNLMVKRGIAGLPFLIAVDEDLKYTGADETLAKAFTGGTTQQGWRIVFLDPRTDQEWPGVVEDALRAVGFDGVEPVWAPAAGAAPQRSGSALDRFGDTVAAPGLDPLVGRASEVAEIAASLLQWRPGLPLIVGPPGAGKSRTLAAIAERVGAIIPGTTLVAVDLGRLFSGTFIDAERENLLAAIVGEASGKTDVVLALERLELVCTETRHGAFTLARAVEHGCRIVGTALAATPDAFKEPPLARHLHRVVLTPLTPGETREAVRGAVGRITAHHGVVLDDELVPWIVERAAALAGPSPATALALTDAACACARVAGDDRVGLAHIYIAACGYPDAEER